MCSELIPGLKAFEMFKWKVYIYTYTHVHALTHPSIHGHTQNQNIKVSVQILSKPCALFALVPGSCRVVQHQRKRKINHKRNRGTPPWPAGDNYLQTLANNCCDNQYILVLSSSVTIYTKVCSEMCFSWIFIPHIANCILLKFHSNHV